MKKIISAVVIVGLVLGGFGVGFWYGQKSRPSIEQVTGVINLEQDKPQSVDFSLFWDAWSKVQEKYVNREDLDYQEMVYGAISGMLKSLGDPYTIFMTPQENKSFSEAISGNFEGIGIEIGIRNDVLTIVAPIEDTPAKKAGLQAGDILKAVNNYPTPNIYELKEAIKQVPLVEGQGVVLDIFRPRNNQKLYISFRLKKYDLKGR